jgi:5'(3')-deoxyribonucleotidase
MRYPELYRDLEPIEGALVGMKKLVDAGHDVIIATAVPKCAGIAYHGKLEWIRRNMPWFNLNNFVSIQRKELLDGDLMLDDGPHFIEAWNKTGRISVVFDCPWNKECKSLYRVKHWNEFLKLIEKLCRTISHLE